VTAGTVRVDGARRLRSTLRRAGVDVADLRAVHAAVVAVVVPAVRPPIRSGRLAGTVRGSGTTTSAIVRAGYASVPYAGPIHWGWPSRGIAAQPFLTDAAQATEPAWIGVYWSHVERTIESVSGV